MKNNNILKNQSHLNYSDRINFGAFYTPQNYVNIVWKMIFPFLNEKSVILDSSCGYGNFFNYKINCKRKANDIDFIAYSETKKNFSELEVFNKNALFNVNRIMFNINENDQLIIIGNPPYNYKTSIIRNNIKNNNLEIDIDIKARDYGISFLLSYYKLNADFICILHPLSYLIKKTNFNYLNNFTKNYKLIDSLIIDSSTFLETSKKVSFPIIIALYKKDYKGMNYKYIEEYEFKTISNKTFKLKNLDFISNYINKYPLKNKLPKEDDILFWTMRDINALKRNKTFVNQFSNKTTIIIDKSKLDYYIYVDVFKKYSYLIPYYFGNFDIIINNELFQKYKNYFIAESLTRNSFLKNYVSFNNDISIKEAKEKIEEYFNILLEEC